ncbi:MAG: Ig-like domain-containing protein [Candidatus Nanopelagicales bacterium]
MGALALVATGALAAPATAAGEYTLSYEGPFPAVVGQPENFLLSNPSLPPGGLYCLVATGPATVSSSGSTPIGTQTTLTFPAAGSYSVQAYEGLLGGACGGGSMLGSPVQIGVAGSSAADFNFTPSWQSAAVNQSASYSVTPVDGNGNPTTLGPGQSIFVSAPGYSGVSFTHNGITSSSVTLTGASPTFYFSARNSVAQTAVLLGSLTGGASETAQLSTIATGSIAVTPKAATTPIGGSTTLTVSLVNGIGLPLSGVPVTVFSSGRNTFGSTIAGTTNAAGQVVWVQKDNAPAGSPNLVDQVTFSANGWTTQATITYVGGSLTVAPATASANFGGSTQLTVTLVNAANVPIPNQPVTVSSTGRNVFGSTSAGSTNANGQVVWTQKDNAPASNPANQDVVTFTANGLSATATINYSTPPPAATVTVTSPSNGSSISSGGLFGVSAQSTGVAAGTTAYLTLNGSAKASSTVQANGFIRFDNTSLGGGQWIPAQAGNYAVRICGGTCGPVQATSQTFSLNIIPFQIVGQPEPGAGQLDFTVATGNWQPGTTIYLTRNGISAATGRVQQVGQQIVIQTRNLSGKYQVRVNSNQGYVYGNQAGVVTIP